MAETGLLERALRRDRVIVLTALAAVTALAWIYTVTGAGPDMRSMPMMMGAMPMAWTPGHAALMFAMWAVMMVAMMLPSAAPMILLFAAITRKDGGARPHRATLAFAIGYIVIWAGFSIAATAAQWGLERAALLSPGMASTSAILGGSLLVAAGLYQFTPQKETCLRHCRSPLEFLTTHWRLGPFRMGLSHGLYCLGCCWALMLTLFVGGVMNLLWVAGLALLVLAEKVAPGGRWLGRIAGAALVMWGGTILLAV